MFYWEFVYLPKRVFVVKNYNKIQQFESCIKKRQVTLQQIIDFLSSYNTLGLSGKSLRKIAGRVRSYYIRHELWSHSRMYYRYRIDGKNRSHDMTLFEAVEFLCT